MDVDLIEEPAYLHCVVTGRYDVREAIDRLSHVITWCRSTGYSNVLVDYRTMEGYPSAIERILFTEEALDVHQQHLRLAGKPVRIAFLGSPSVIGSYNPGLEIAEQSGFSATITADPLAAIAFLMGPEESGATDR